MGFRITGLELAYALHIHQLSCDTGFKLPFGQSLFAFIVATAGNDDGLTRHDGFLEAKRRVQYDK